MGAFDFFMPNKEASPLHGFWSKDDPSAPSAPTISSEVNAWMQALPQIYSMQSQYGQQSALDKKALMEKLYPQTAGLQENLANQAISGMQSGVPSWMQDQYRSNMNAQLGSNVGSPAGADYMSRGLMQQQQDWRQYYQSMAMSLANRQPLASSSLDYMQSFSPNAVMQGMNQQYGTQAGIYGNQLDAQAQYGNPLMSAVGGIGGTMFGGMMGGGAGTGLNAVGSMGGNSSWMNTPSQVTLDNPYR